MMPRYFLFGMIRVPMWEYRCGLTIAQIELLTIDQPIIVYKREQDKPKPGEKGFTRTAEQAQKEYQKWKTRQEAEKKAKGKTLNMQDFLRGEVKETH